MGTLPPFVEGNSPKVFRRIARLANDPSAWLSYAFLIGSLTAFGILHVVGLEIAAHADPQLLYALAGALTFGLVLHDVRSLRKRRFCALGPRRQTPKWIPHALRSDRLGLVVWGFDTGLGATTFRMTNGWWVLAVAVLAGLHPVGIALAYALGFAVPLIWAKRIQSRAEAGEPLQMSERLPVVRTSTAIGAMLLSAVFVLMV